jgi:hypothetical protein
VSKGDKVERVEGKIKIQPKKILPFLACVSQTGFPQDPGGKRIGMSASSPFCPFKDICLGAEGAVAKTLQIFSALSGKLEVHSYRKEENAWFSQSMKLSF